MNQMLDDCTIYYPNGREGDSTYSVIYDDGELFFSQGHFSESNEVQIFMVMSFDGVPYREVEGTKYYPYATIYEIADEPTKELLDTIKTKIEAIELKH